MKTSYETLLATGVTVEMYKAWVVSQNREAIAGFLYLRFSERYLDPVEQSVSKHGFCMMAVACLMIEALESFRLGWPESNGKSKRAFQKFFANEVSNRSLCVFNNHSEQFYKHVRCGILHQAETTGGWRIRRIGPLFSEADKIINARLFLRALRICLANYREELKSSDWEAEIWKNCRSKLTALCTNTRA